MLNLDTHVLLNALVGRLSPPETRLLRNDRWSISADGFWVLRRSGSGFASSDIR